MAIRNIMKEGESCLRQNCRVVHKFDKHLQELAADMLETMKAAHGIGLAAPQVGVLKRMFVMNLGNGDEDMVLVNPEITASEGEQEDYEGCLSLPDLFGVVVRPQKIGLRYQDLTGTQQETVAEGLRAVCISHELDHLDGILFRDKAKGELCSFSQDEAEDEDEDYAESCQEKEAKHD